MKHIRIIAIFLIMTLAASPALAAVCAASCASQSIMSSLHHDDMSGMKNCHESSKKQEQTKSNTEHKSCAMGAGCHFTQITPIESFTKYVFAELTATSFPRFVPSEKSVDLSPPLKPPA